jgi:hypothetical protein
MESYRISGFVSQIEPVHDNLTLITIDNVEREERQRIPFYSSVSISTYFEKVVDISLKVTEGDFPTVEQEICSSDHRKMIVLSKQDVEDIILKYRTGK